MNRKDAAPRVKEIVEKLGFIPSGDIARAEREICQAAGLDLYWPGRETRGWQQPQREDALREVRLVPDLAYLFIFHRDGYLREAALGTLDEAIPSAFFATAIAWRMNDWVPQVRDAASSCAARTFVLSRPEVLAESAWALFDRQNSWSRWGTDRDILREIVMCPDVRLLLLEQVVDSGAGPAARLLRQVLRGSSFDEHLLRLARESIQPSVRTVAAQTMLEERAKWIVGWEPHWIDKRYGLSERVPKYRERPIASVLPRHDLIEMLLADKSAMVRRVALDGVIRFALDADRAREWAERALQDKSPSVRERAEYIMRKVGDADSTSDAPS